MRGMKEKREITGEVRTWHMRTIYYIEDDENIAQLVSEYLSRHGCSVSVFPTIAGAKEAFLQRLPIVRSN